MADSFAAVDVRRQAGWLPDAQEDLEAWLAGHRERVSAKGEQVVLHPVISEFEELINSDPVVRMYLDQMIAQVPQTRQYRKRHLESVQQMLRLINEVLTVAPEFSEDAMVMLPLGAILDWTMGTRAGFAAFRDRRINGLATGVQRQDRFWIKSQPYSLQDMLANDESVDLFAGGTVYQAFLSATNYHRWHSPVAGTIVRAFVQQGTYYSEADSEGAGAVEPQNSQSYLAHVAARAIILIEADDPVIGLLAFVPIGMSDVSSCVIDPNIRPGYHVSKGEELGYFQFGGSTHCLVFRPGAIAGFSLPAIPQPRDPHARLVRVCSKLATAGSQKG